MNIKQSIIDVVSKSPIGERAVRDQRYRMILTATVSLALNLTYAVYHGVLGLVGKSWWFCALWAYYTVLGTTRFAAVLCERKNDTTPSIDTEYFVMKVSGVLLLLLGCVLAGINYMSLRVNIAVQYGEIAMITIAAYTFGKLALAIVRVVKHRHHPSPILAVIRRIGYAEAAVSVLSLQRSMLVSFGEMPTETSNMMNGLTGAGVFIFIVSLGSIMIRKKR